MYKCSASASVFLRTRLGVSHSGVAEAASGLLQERLARNYLSKLLFFTRMDFN